MAAIFLAAAIVSAPSPTSTSSEPVIERDILMRLADIERRMTKIEEVVASQVANIDQIADTVSVLADKLSELHDSVTAIGEDPTSWAESAEVTPQPPPPPRLTDSPADSPPEPSTETTAEQPTEPPAEPQGPPADVSSANRPPAPDATSSPPESAAPATSAAPQPKRVVAPAVTTTPVQQVDACPDCGDTTYWGALSPVVTGSNVYQPQPQRNYYQPQTQQRPRRRILFGRWRTR